MANATAQVQSTSIAVINDTFYWPLIGGSTATRTYQTGEMIGRRSDGYAQACDDSAALDFLGIVQGAPVQVDSGDADGAKLILIRRPAKIEMPLDTSTASIASNAGAPLYSADSGHVSLSTGSFGNIVGYLSHVVGSTPASLTGSVVGFAPCSFDNFAGTGAVAGNASFSALTATVSPGPIAGLAGSSSAGGIITVTGGAGNGSGNAGGAVTTAGGAAGTGNAAGGAVSLTGGVGAGSSAGGAGSLTGGASAASSSGAGGAVSVTGGAVGSSGTGTGGAASLTAGAGRSGGAAGSVTIDAGAANSGTAGTVAIGATNASRVTSGMLAVKAIATPVAAAGAGGGVSGAAALGAANFVEISSDGNTKGVKLATSVAGDWKIIVNTSSTAANLFAASGGTINGGSADAGCAIPASKGVIALSMGADTWIVSDLTARAGAAA